MSVSSTSLLTTRRFLPLFVTQTLGALNDNLFKNALVGLILFKMAKGGAPLVVLTSGIFILPYAILSSLAGQIADRSDKSRILRLTKIWELAIMVVAVLGFMDNSMSLLMVVLAGLGVQAAFFSPLKYGIMPDHLREDELVGGNALIEAGTFAGILVGTIAGGILIQMAAGPAIVSAAGILVALAGIAAAWKIPTASAADPSLRINPNFIVETMILVRQAAANQPVWLSILGISWFWTIGAVLLGEFPVIVKDVFHGTQPIATLFLTLFAIGIGAGSVLVGWMLKGEISARHVPFATIGISLFCWDFAHACVGAGDLATVHALLVNPRGWRVAADLFVIALCGGIYSVPLYTIVQEYSEPAFRSRMIAANNIVNAVFMVMGTGIAAGLAVAHFSAPAIIGIAATINLVVAAYICALLPRDILRSLFRWYFERVHGVTVTGLENYPQGGERLVIVSNHLSFLDGCFLAAFLPGVPTFAVATHMTKKWWAKPFLAAAKIFPVDPTNPYATKSMIKAVREGADLVVFPEGRITTTGTLMKIYEGAGLVADKADAKLLPIEIDGLQFSPFALVRSKVKRQWFPPLSITILPPVALNIEPVLRGRARRAVVGRLLHDIMVNTAFATRNTAQPLFGAFVDAGKRFGSKTLIAEDIERNPLSYRKLTLASLVLGRHLAKRTELGEPVGVLLPNSVATLATFLGLQAFGRVPAMLNFSAGADAMLNACKAAAVRRVILSRRFVDRAKLSATVERLSKDLEMIWLEDIRDSLGAIDKLRGLLDLATRNRLPGMRADPDATAAVLFTSGSEGTPKGVALSHRNILSNWAQLSSVIDFGASDSVLNAMPMFHSFGLTGGTLLPLLSGARIFFYPSPLHYKIVPELVYDTDATIIFGTDTFLSGWARFAHPYDFYRIRYAFAGAEKLRDATRRLYAERFGVRVLEGYGVTETAPVLALNTAMHAKPGTVGRLVPGIQHRLEPVPGITEGGRLHVRGPNVMRGYLKLDQPGILQPPEDGWYDTGDIVTVDAEGYVEIRGRAKRFAKIAGEMVSMAAAETLASTCWPNAAHGVVAVPDPRKGEQLVLATTAAEATVPALLAHARERGIAELMVPRTTLLIPQIPLLGTGKTDYPSLQKLVEAELLARVRTVSDQIEEAPAELADEQGLDLAQG